MVFNDLLNYYYQIPLLIKLVWITSILLLMAIFLLICFLKIYRSHLRKTEEENLKLSKEYEINLINYLYAEEGSEDQKSIIDKLSFCISNKVKRKIIIRVFLKLKKEISGEMSLAIQNLYIKTGLVNYAMRKLNHKKWYIIANGVRELTRFQIEEAHAKIYSFVNHPAKEVRKEVQLYLVNLFHFKGLDFLTELHASLSEWDQIQLLEVLRKSDEQQDVDIIPWLQSKNHSVVLFALKIAENFNQYQVQNEIIKLLHHSNYQIREKAILVLGSMHNVDCKPELKNSFSDRSIEEQMAFFKVLEPLISDEDYPFLLEHTAHINFEIRLEALRLIKNYFSIKFEIINEFERSEEFIEMLNFVKTN